MPKRELDLMQRSLVIRSETANPDRSSVEVVIASEVPVDTMDAATGRTLPEVLRMDGLRWRNANTQLPIVDSHDASTVRNVLGSVRNIRTEGGELVGDAVFASDADSQNAFAKIREGHLTDFSITAQRKKVSRLQGTDTMRVGERDIHGPAVVVDEWTPLDASLTAAGADPTSTVRGIVYRALYTPPQLLARSEMTDELRTALRALGMPEDTTDEDAARWATANLAAKRADEPEEKPEEVAAEAPAEEEAKEEERSTRQASAEDAVKRALADENKRRKEITAMVTNANLERSIADELIDRQASVDVARKHVLDVLTSVGQPVGTSVDVRVKSDGITRFFDAARDGLVIRSLRSARVGDKVFGEKGPAIGAEDFANQSLLRIAERSLNVRGIRTERLSPSDIARAAMGKNEVLFRHGLLERSSDGAAYHTSGMFSNLMLDAVNKTLLAAYDEAQPTWSIWARQAPSVADFKNINRVRFSEAPNPELVPENARYPEKKFSDAKESYSVEKYGEMFSVSWETLVNDDLDAISRVPAMHGNAMRRKQNALVYSVLTGNAALADSKALFHADHANYVSTGGAAPGVTTLNAGYLAMATQTGLTSDAILNIAPAYLIVPQALAATAYQLIGSIADPAAGGSAAGNSNTLNIYGPQGPRRLIVVPEALLDSASTKAWYLAASPSQIDTVELSFLQGEESPVVETENGFDTDTMKIKVRQTMGAKAIDYRGLYCNIGQ